MPLLQAKQIHWMHLLLALICLAGSILLVDAVFLRPGQAMPLEPGLFAEKINIPLQFHNLGVMQLPLEMENFLLFQNFESLPPITQYWVTHTFGIVLWGLFSLAMVYVSTFNRTYFIIAAVGAMALSLLAGFNGLNIGGVNSTLGLLVWILGMIGPAIIIHTFFDHLTLRVRGAIIFTMGMLTLPLLAMLSPVVDPYLMMFENTSLMAMAISVIFFAYIGHSFLTAVFYLLVNLNKGVGLKITWHFIIVFLIYLFILFLLFLRLTGNTTFGLPVVPAHVLLILVGALGFLEVMLKTDQIGQPYPHKSIGLNLYLIGFAIALITFWKAEATANVPMSDFLAHGFVYTQIAFSAIFFAYVLANFSTLMNSGQLIHRVLFNPQFFAYIHMRLGALIGMISLIMFADGVIGLQFSTSSTNLTADYYYATRRPLEANILFENAWDRYRRNPKAKNAAAHLRLNQNQPTLAKRELVQSFEVSPSVNDIILLSSILHRENNIFEAIFYLNKGLEIFSDNMHLQNNLALLHSKTNQAEQAMSLLEAAGNHSVVRANKIGLQSKHLIRFEQEIAPENDLIAKINALAYHNLRGDIAPFELAYQEDAPTPLINRALLSNQWSNQSNGSTEQDLALIDEQLGQELRPNEEEEWRQLRVLRSLQDNHIDQALIYSQGLAFGFAGSAPYYHQLSAVIYAGQLDFTKAAAELRLADQKGLPSFKPEHLALLYFGGQQNTAIKISAIQGTAWPEWMVFEQGELVENEETRFFTALSDLNEATKEALMEQLNALTQPDLKARLAYEIAWRKAHWMDQKELKNLQATILLGKPFDQEQPYIESLFAFLSGEKEIPQEGRLANMVPEQDLTANAYWAPLVLMAVDQEEDAVEKYNILQEAAIFNRDPLLWIQLVKYSRQAGLHQYATDALADMRGWVDDETLTELQIKHL